MSTTEAGATQSSVHPLTEQQHAMLDFIGSREDDYYLMVETFRLTGEVDVVALRSAVAGLITRHGSLRSLFPDSADTYLVVPDSPAHIDGVFEEAGAFPSADCALRAGIERVARPLKLDAELPLRVWLGRVSPTETVLAIAGHHLVFDGWTFKLFYEELATAYGQQADAPAEQEVSQYWDAAAGGRKTARKPDFRSLLTHGYQEIRALHARAIGPLGPAGMAHRHWPGELAGRLREASAGYGVTPYAIGAAAMLSALSESLGDSQVILGTAFTGRTNGQAARALGYFSTTVFIGADLAEEMRPRQFVKAVALQAITWQMAPRLQWEGLLAEHEGQDLYPLKFAFERAEMAQPAPVLPGIAVERIHPPSSGEGKARRPADISVTYGDDGIDARVKFRRDVVDEAWVNGLLARFGTHLDTLCSQAADA
ncbi:condensation domain-containing protein [Streptomyces goshikiensis]|uniref:condensation domain-containing protein n=1 Tax=Streptomyces goshikiensis TaxID=1942 RepID=UPI0036FD74FB